MYVDGDGSFMFSCPRRCFEVTAVLVEHALSHAAREEEIHRMYTKDICIMFCLIWNTYENMFDEKGFPQQTCKQMGLVSLFSAHGFVLHALVFVFICGTLRL